jgi:hypothetical protein
VVARGRGGTPLLLALIAVLIVGLSIAGTCAIILNRRRHLQDTRPKLIRRENNHWQSDGSRADRIACDLARRINRAHRRLFQMQSRAGRQGPHREMGGWEDLSNAAVINPAVRPPTPPKDAHQPMDGMTEPNNRPRIKSIPLTWQRPKIRPSRCASYGSLWCGTRSRPARASAARRRQT